MTTSKPLSRRVFLKLSGTVSAGAALSACSFAQRLTATPTGTVTQLPTVTPTPTATPAPTITPTSTDTPKPTSTPTRTLTATIPPTETPIPTSSWFTDFESGNFDCCVATAEVLPGNSKESFYKIADDPTGSARGKVYIGQVVAQSPLDTHRAYPARYFRFKPGAFASEFDLRIDKNVSPAIDILDGTWLSIYSSFDKADPVWHPNLTINLRRRSRLSLTAYTFGYGESFDEDRSNSSIEFPFDEWIHVRVEVTSDRMIRVHQNQVLVSELPLHKSALLGTAGGHWGLYCGPNMRRLKVYNDNLVLVTYA